MSTFRALLALSFVLFFSHSAEAQAVRFDYIASTTSAQCAPGKQCPLVVLPGTQVNICSGSVTTLASCLSSPATTYTDASTGTPCATTSQLTPQTGGSCRATSDNQGNYGFWILPGSYNYFLRVPATAGGGTYGPYPLAIGASAGCPLGATCDANYVTLPLACAAAGSGLLYVTRTWIGLTSQAFACPMSFTGNGVLRPNSGQTISFNVVSFPANHQTCDISLGGVCNITSATGEVQAYFWGAICPATTSGTDVTANFQAGINSAIATGMVFSFTPGFCTIGTSGTGLIVAANNKQFLMHGEGSGSATTSSKSVFVWKGNGTGATNSALTISGCYHCDFSNFGIQTDGTHVLDIALHPISVTNLLQTQGRFHNIWISDQSNTNKLGIGIYIDGQGDFQNDQWRIEGVTVSNVAAGGAPILLDGFETVDNTFDNDTLISGACSVSNGPITFPSNGAVSETYGLGFGGNFLMRAGFVTAATDANFCLGAQSGGITILEGFRSENSNRFLRTIPAPGNAFPIPVHIRGIDFSTGNGLFAADHQVIQYWSGCALDIGGPTIFGVSGASVPVAIALGGNCITTGANNNIDNVTVIGSNTTDATVLFPTGYPNRCGVCTITNGSGANLTFSYNSASAPPRYYIKNGTFGTVSGVTNAIIVDLPANVLFPVLTGGTMLDILLPPTTTLSLQAGANTFQLRSAQTDFGAKAIHESSVGFSNLGVGYPVQAVVTLIYDAFNNDWRDIRQ